MVNIVMSVFLRGGGKGSAHGWVPSVDTITAASNVLLEIFALNDYGTDSISFRKFWPKSSAHNRRKYQILSSSCLLFRVDPNSVHSGFDMDDPVLCLVSNEGTDY